MDESETAESETDIPDRDSLQPLKDLSRFRYGQFSVRPILPSPRTERIELECHLQPRWLPRFPSQWDVLKDQVVRTHPAETCSIFYSFPWKSPGFMAANYLVCGPNTEYSTLRTSVDLLALLAKARGAQAIVCQAFSGRLTERIMNRWGYVRHAQSLGPNHFIHRLS